MDFRAIPQRSQTQWLVLGAALFLSLVCLAAAVGMFLVNRSVSSLGRVAVADHLVTLDAGGVGEEPSNLLLVGFESPPATSVDDLLERDRLDVRRRAAHVLVIRIDPERRQTTMVSLAPDQQVAAPTGVTALSTIDLLGGPSMLLDGLQESLGIPIHHYAEIDIERIGPVIDELAPIRVFVPYPLRDTQTGFTAGEPGCVLFDGDSLVQYLQSHDMEGDPEDGDWMPTMNIDGTASDERDRDVLASLLTRLDLDLRNPGPMLAVGSVAADVLTVDDRISRNDLVAFFTAARDYQREALFGFEVAGVDVAAGDVPAADNGALGVLRGADATTVPGALRPGMIGLRSVTCLPG